MNFSLLRVTSSAALTLRASSLLLALLACTPVLAEEVVCHYTYGGETNELVAAPVASPYAVKGIEVGSYFLFRVVFQKTPRDIAAIKVYTYAKRDDKLVLMHEASYPYPLSPARKHQAYGFTGLHFIYEPMREGELQYWCELREFRAPSAQGPAR